MHVPHSYGDAVKRKYAAVRTIRFGDGQPLESFYASPQSDRRLNHDPGGDGVPDRPLGKSNIAKEMAQVRF